MTIEYAVYDLLLLHSSALRSQMLSGSQCMCLEVMAPVMAQVMALAQMVQVPLSVSSTGKLRGRCTSMGMLGIHSSLLLRHHRWWRHIAP